MTEQSLIGTKEERRHRIGGSDFGSVLDINPYKSRFELVLNKAGVLYDFFTGNEYTKRGEELEDTIIKMFEDATNLKVTDQQKEFVKESENGNLDLVVHIDGFIHSENAVFEAKTSDYKSNAWEEGIPEYYKAQLSLNMYLSGADKSYIAVAKCKNDDVIDFQYFEYFPEMTEGEILGACEAFSEDVRKAKLKYGVINNGLLVQNNNIDDMVSELEELKQKISETNRSLKPYEDRKKQIEKELKEMIGINSGVESSLYRVVLGNRIYQPSSDYSVSRASLRVEYKEN
ncbi:MAG: YqaJ viral recombinase family protein [Elusimicrobia bacterium]|nr:YqaJ viral recombinase family protein [Elusimicrobiota bacterium]